NNRVLEMTGPDQHAHREIAAIEDGETGTVFFRVRRDGDVDTSFGITDQAEPSDFAHSRAYVNNQNDDTLLVRDGGDFASAGTWSADPWQCVWIAAGHQRDE